MKRFTCIIDLFNGNRDQPEGADADRRTALQD